MTYANATIVIRDSRFSVSAGSTHQQISYNGTLSKKITTTVASPFSVVFKKAGYTVDGRSVDVTIAYDTVEMTANAANVSGGVPVAFFNRLSQPPPSSFAFYAPGGSGEVTVKTSATIRITYEGTSTLVPNEAQFTFTDLDGYWTQYPDFAEGITLGSGFTRTYLRKDHIFDKNKIQSSGGRRFCPSYYKEAAGWEEEYTACTYIAGGEGKLTWTGIYCGTEIGASYKGYPEWGAPSKSAASDGINPAGVIRYEISQFFPYTASSNKATNVIVSDTLAGIYDMSNTSMKVLDANRVDVSNKWNISKSGRTMSATANDPYNSLGQHYFVIETKIDRTSDKSPYVSPRTESRSSPSRTRRRRR